jgi:ATP-dependent helicase/nuclease subunit A
VANFIDGVIGKRVLVESRNRGARPSDFMILFRRRDVKTMKNIINALKNKGIPTAGLDRISLKDELIVEDLIAFAEFSVFRMDDLMCARCLKSPLVGMTENDLMRICIGRGDKKLWAYLRENEELWQKYSLEKLQNYMDKASQLSTHDFFMNMLMDGGIEKFIRRLGSDCLDVLQEFSDMIMTYEKENNPALQKFLVWFRSFDHEIKRTPGDAKDAVRLMTVHGAKGLQAPFVLVADGDYFKTNDEKILENEEGVVLWDFAKNFRARKMQQLHKDNAQAAFEESLRLLYVAMTRAEDFLCILAKNREKSQKELPKKCWYSTIKSKFNESKFTEVVEFGEKLMRFGTYKYLPQMDNAKKHDDVNVDIPLWYKEKLCPQPEMKVRENLKTPQMVYGDCVHFLLTKIPGYENHHLRDDIANNLLENFELSDELKKSAKSEAYEVMEKFNFLFYESSMAEVSFLHEGIEGRIDKIAKLNGKIWIVDFKTGVPQPEIPSAYTSQLHFYRRAVSNILKIDNSAIKTALLWTKSCNLAEVLDDKTAIPSVGFKINDSTTLR